MSTIITHLNFSVKDLSIGDNRVTVSYKGMTSISGIGLRLEIQKEPQVNFKKEDEISLVSRFGIRNKLTEQIESHSEDVIINVAKKPAQRTPVIFILSAVKGDAEVGRRRKTIFF